MRQLFSQDTPHEFSVATEAFRHLFDNLPAFSSIIEKLAFTPEELEEREYEINCPISLDVMHYPVEIYGASIDLENVMNLKNDGVLYEHPNNRELFRLDQMACNYTLYEKYLKLLENKISLSLGKIKPEQPVAVAAPAPLRPVAPPRRPVPAPVRLAPVAPVQAPAAVAATMPSSQAVEPARVAAVQASATRSGHFSNNLRSHTKTTQQNDVLPYTDLKTKEPNKYKF